MQRPVWIKICGITMPSDIDLIHSAGADAVGLNFIVRSKRRVDIQTARTIAEAAHGKLERVGVVADLEETQILDLVNVVGLDRIQLHGNEPEELVRRLGSLAYKAVGISCAADVVAAESTSGPRLLADARLGELVGGTGTTFDWSLIEALCRKREVIVAGGLHPGNVSRAVRQLRPFGVDVASGVEEPSSPGLKSELLVRRFVQEIRTVATV
ncbi:MAG TPA: phosphoribosylanthranilate isomerase [Polyangiaceae bacterium]|nr:phosphoribosylanthranilate isomerase [Polyangiaceae bacterium]